LVIFQGMDTAGKDGAVKHIMSGLNPTGVMVHSFKVPTITELEHDYFWRHYIDLPARGMIGIFNRSHYENVLVTKVHPEFILKENLPYINKVEDITPEFWKQRYKQINRFEKNLVQNGTVILKFFLHLSQKEQRKRFLERIDDPKKNWKFSAGDAKERAFWKDYQTVYEEVFSNTSTECAPWFIIPADDKWFTRLAIAEILDDRFEALKLNYPEVSDDVKAQLEVVKQQLLDEK
ncbi:MAG: PPK2 family polyphosphate kinase, partial [Ignavibacteria bacterium]